MNATTILTQGAGDTSVDEEVIAAVKAVGKIDMAFLPGNERNYVSAQRTTYLLNSS